MRVFETKEFARFARKACLSVAKLLDAAKDVAAGRFDADLGGDVFKQRIAREDAGKSGGFRTIIVFRAGSHCFFVHGFAKNEKANVTPKELKALKRLASVYTALSAEALNKALGAGQLVELEAHKNEHEGEAKEGLEDSGDGS